MKLLDFGYIGLLSYIDSIELQFIYGIITLVVCVLYFMYEMSVD